MEVFVLPDTPELGWRFLYSWVLPGLSNILRFPPSAGPPSREPTRAETSPTKTLHIKLFGKVLSLFGDRHPFLASSLHNQQDSELLLNMLFGLNQATVISGCEV